jgi:RNA polymerase sigma factor (sigma-70 family)
LEQVMALHFRTLFHYGTKFSADDDFIKDHIQDLFLNLWDRRQSLEAEVNVKAYLLASLRRRLHRALLAQKRFVNYSPDESPAGFELELSVEEAFIADEATDSLCRELKLQLENLPQRQREAVYLKFYEDLTRDQIAEVMGINAQSVSNLLQVAIKHLKINWKAEFLLVAFLLFGW